MIQSVAHEFQNAPIATITAVIGGLSGLIGLAMATWTYLSKKRAPATSEVGLRGPDVETPPDFRVVLVCLFVMPAVVTGFGLLASWGVGSATWFAAIVLPFLFAAASVTVTALLSGVMIGPWLRSMYHERTLLKVKHGYYGPLSFAEYAKSVGYIFSWLNCIIILLFTVEPAFARLSAAIRPDPEGTVGLMSILLFLGFCAAIGGFLSNWASFLFRSQAKTF